jgi:hypothetical protein
MTVDRRITKSASDTIFVTLRDVTTGGRITEELSKSEVDKKNLVGQLANT